MKQYEENFTEMSTKEKDSFLSRFGVVSISCNFYDNLFAVMAFTRCWNTLKRILPLEPPQIIQIAFDRLWECMKTGEVVVTQELEAFQEQYNAAVNVIVNGDDSELDTPEKERFYEMYLKDWNHDDSFLEGQAHLLYDITYDTGEASERVGNLLKYPTEPMIEACFTTLERKGACSSAELEKREEIIHDTPVFCHVIARLQEDMKTAVSGVPVEEIREKYQSMYLFSEEEIAQIIATRS